MLSSPHNEVGHRFTDPYLQTLIFNTTTLSFCLPCQAICPSVSVMTSCLSMCPSATHLQPVVGPAAKLHLAVLVIKWEPGDVDLARGLEDPYSNHSGVGIFMLYSRLSG